jgi:TnpA family transposase
MWGDGQVVAVDGSQVETWENNLLAESHIRYGGIAMRHVSDTYIALFSHFIPCGVWEAVYIVEGLLRNESDIQPDTIHADTQGKSLPVLGLAAMLGFELLPPSATGRTSTSTAWPRRPLTSTSTPCSTTMSSTGT